MLYYIQQVRETLKNQKGNIMHMGFSFMLILTGLIDFVLWSMGKVPYGALCWAVPLIFGVIGAVIKQICD